MNKVSKIVFDIENYGVQGNPEESDEGTRPQDLRLTLVNNGGTTKDLDWCGP